MLQIVRCFDIIVNEVQVPLYCSMLQYSRLFEAIGSGPARVLFGLIGELPIEDEAAARSKYKCPLNQPKSNLVISKLWQGRIQNVGIEKRCREVRKGRTRADSFVDKFKRGRTGS